MLILSRKVNQRILIADNIEVTVTKIAGDRVSIGVECHKEIKVLRSELLEKDKHGRAA